MPYSPIQVLKDVVERDYGRRGEAAISDFPWRAPATLGAHVRDEETGLKGFLPESDHGHEVAEPGLGPQSDCKTCRRGPFRGQKWHVCQGHLTWF